MQIYPYYICYSCIQVTLFVLFGMKTNVGTQYAYRCIT
jgi:hypothetical protein